MFILGIIFNMQCLYLFQKISKINCLVRGGTTIKIETIINKIQVIAKELSKEKRIINIMSFCGTHEYTIASSGIRSILPKNIQIIAGPGCPVCVTPAHIIDTAIQESLKGKMILTYGDAYKLPGIKWLKEKGFPKSLEEAVAKGGKVIPVYSIHEAVRHARKTRKETIFLAIGFETTAPATVLYLEKNDVPKNLSFLLAHRLTPPIIKHILENYPENPIDGVIAPGHVSAITGAKAWEFLATQYSIPTVISGFDPEDVLETILYILIMIKKGKPELINQYKRVVTWEGNTKAQKALTKYFEVRTSFWRGIGWVQKSGYYFRKEYEEYDALIRHYITLPEPYTRLDELPPACKCAEITLGIKKPIDCPLFLKSCTPEKPYGPCMVSHEGTCNVWARTKQFKSIKLE